MKQLLTAYDWLMRQSAKGNSRLKQQDFNRLLAGEITSFKALGQCCLTETAYEQKIFKCWQRDLKDWTVDEYIAYDVYIEIDDKATEWLAIAEIDWHELFEDEFETAKAIVDMGKRIRKGKGYNVYQFSDLYALMLKDDDSYYLFDDEQSLTWFIEDELESTYEM